MKTPRVLTLTMNPALDVSTSVQNVFPEHKLRCDAPRFDPGGGGINVARVITRLGGNALALYCGGGGAGAMLRELLVAEGVPEEAVPIAGYTRESFTVLESASGQQYRFVLPGPRLSHQEWECALEAVLTMEPLPRIVVASGSLPPGVPTGFYGELATRLRTHGVRFILDTSGDPLLAAFGQGAFLLKPSLREFRQMAGARLELDAEQERAAHELVLGGACEVMVVSLGAGGALVATTEGCLRLRGPVVPVRSKVGAGDSMVAGIAHSLSLGRPVPEAVRFGVAAGTAAVMNPGTELCHRADVERLFALVQVCQSGGAIAAE